MTISLTTWTEKPVEKERKIVQCIFVELINPNEYMVVCGPLEGIVNLTTKSCICKKFDIDLDQYPRVYGMVECLY